jgi:hypothetical protein
VKKLTRRVIAVILGCVFAAGLTIGVALLFVPFLADATVVPEWVHEVTLQVGDPPETDACHDSPDAMHVFSSAVGEHDEPLAKRDAVSSNPPKVRAEYSAGWAEKKVLQLSISERSATILASYETDYGDFRGSVVAGDSRVHRHGNDLCYDLSVKRRDGSAIQERWIGRVALP